MTFVTANLAQYQAKITMQHQAGELRVRTPEVFNNLRKYTEFMIPSHKEIKYSAKRTTGEVNFFTRSTRALGTGGETHNHTGVVGGSSVVVPSWTPYDDRFKYSVKQANSSLYSIDEMLMSDMINVNNNFSEGLETVAVNFIHNNRSGVNVSTAEGTFDAANDVFEVQEDFSNLTSTGYRMLQIIKSNMRINKWTGSLNIYADTRGYNKMQALVSNGAGNSINTSFQFGNDKFIHSPEIDALASALGYTDGYYITEADGNSAVLDWIPEQNRAGLVTPVSKYGSLIHPTTGLLLATHEYIVRADESGGDGEPQDNAVQTQFFSYLSPNHSPLSVVNETPYYAFAAVPAILA